MAELATLKSVINIRNFYWVTILAAFLGTSVLTFSVGPISLFPFRFAIIFLLAFFLFRSGLRFDISKIFVRKSLLFHFFWVAYAIVSVVWAADKTSALKHVIFMGLNVIIIFFSIYVLQSVNDFWKLIRLWVTLFVLLIPVGIWEFLTGNHLPSSGLNVVDEGYELYKFAPTATFSNQNDYATWISLTFPMLLSLFKFQKIGIKKLALFFVLLGTILVLFFTTSRANYIAIILSTGFWLYFMTGLREKIKYFIAFLTLLVIGFIAMPPHILESLSFYIEDLVALTQIGSGEDAGINVREYLIINALYFSLGSWGFGVGAGNVEYYMDNFPIYPVNDIGNVHNWFVELLANYGVVILVGYIVLLIFVFRSLWRYHKQVTDRRERLIIEALLCPLVGFPIASISSSSLMAFNPLWIYFGVVLAYINYKLREKKEAS